jgi:hypothetical protein
MVATSGKLVLTGQTVLDGQKESHERLDAEKQTGTLEAPQGAKRRDYRSGPRQRRFGENHPLRPPQCGPRVDSLPGDEKGDRSHPLHCPAGLHRRDSPRRPKGMGRRGGYQHQFVDDPCLNGFLPFSEAQQDASRRAQAGVESHAGTSDSGLTFSTFSATVKVRSRASLRTRLPGATIKKLPKGGAY